jgi:hypothetical protein
MPNNDIMISFILYGERLVLIISELRLKNIDDDDKTLLNILIIDAILNSLFIKATL